MASSTAPRNSRVLASLGEWAEEGVKAFDARSGSHQPQIPHVRLDGKPHRVKQALRKALDLRNVQADPDINWRPELILVAAAADLPSLEPARQVWQHFEADCKRRYLQSQGRLIVLAGPTPRHPDGPTDSQLRELEEFTKPHQTIVLVDASSRGYCYSFRALAWLAGNLVYYLTTNAALRQCLEVPLQVPSSERRFSVGLSRLKLTEAPLRAWLIDRLKQVLLEQLFNSAGGANLFGSLPHMADRQGSGLSLAAVAETSARTADRQARLLAQAQHEAAINHTRLQIRQWLPAPRPSWWQVVLGWLGWWSPPAPPMPPQPKYDVAALHREVVTAETVCLRSAWLQQAFRSEARSASGTRCQYPLEVTLADLASVREKVAAQLPPLAQVAEQLRQVLSPEDLLVDADSMPALARHLDALCRRSLGLDGCRLTTPQDYTHVVAELGRHLGLAFPGKVRQTRRLLLRDPSLPPVPGLEGFTQALGEANEIVELEIGQGLSFLSLLKERKKTDGPTQ